MVERQIFVAGIRQHVAAAARSQPPEECIGDAATIRDHVLRVLRNELREVGENAAAEDGEEETVHVGDVAVAQTKSDGLSSVQGRVQPDWK